MDKIKEIFNFDNIGNKLKTWAKWSCWISIIIIWISAAITFLVFLFTEGRFLLALLVLIGAALYSLLIWVGSWTTYALGQYVEDIHTIRAEGVPVINGSTILPSQKVSASGSASPAEPLHKWRCDGCGNMRTQTPCEHCGRNENVPKAPYRCGKCGHEGPYEGSCPSCGSSIKYYNR